MSVISLLYKLSDCLFILRGPALHHLLIVTTPDLLYQGVLLTATVAWLG